MRSIKLTVAYDGTDFAGFQIQPNVDTIQGELETALPRVLGETVRIIGAGRTDSGVHALGQVVSFKTSATIPTSRLPAALNTVLPRDIAVLRAEEVAAGFSARHSATDKLYRYLICVGDTLSPFIRNYCWYLPRRLEVRSMQLAAKMLEGHHDFSAFCAARSDAKSKIRTLRSLRIYTLKDLVVIEAQAESFLYKMVRSIVGALVHVGRGSLSPTEIPDILQSCKRNKIGQIAPPQGLILWQVAYEGLCTDADMPGSIALTLPWGYDKISL